MLVIEIDEIYALMLFNAKSILLTTCKFLATGVILYGGPRASTLLGIPEAASLHHEYNSMACTVEIVDDVFAAIDHIHEHGRYLLTSTTFNCALFVGTTFALNIPIYTFPFWIEACQVVTECNFFLALALFAAPILIA